MLVKIRLKLFLNLREDNETDIERRIRENINIMCHNLEGEFILEALTILDLEIHKENKE